VNGLSFVAVMEFHERVDYRGRDGRAALAAHTGKVRHERLAEQVAFRFLDADKPDRDADKRRRPPAPFLDQPQGFIQRRGALPMASSGVAYRRAASRMPAAERVRAGRGSQANGFRVVQVAGQREARSTAQHRADAEQTPSPYP